jgi:hypothetical protein
MLLGPDYGSRSPGIGHRGRSYRTDLFPRHGLGSLEDRHEGCSDASFAFEKPLDGCRPEQRIRKRSTAGRFGGRLGSYESWIRADGTHLDGFSDRNWSGWKSLLPASPIGRSADPAHCAIGKYIGIRHASAIGARDSAREH